MHCACLYIRLFTELSFTSSLPVWPLFTHLSDLRSHSVFFSFVSPKTVCNCKYLKIMAIFLMKLLGRVALFILLALYFKHLWQDQIIFSKHFWFACLKNVLCLRWTELERKYMLGRRMVWGWESGLSRQALQFLSSLPAVTFCAFWWTFICSILIMSVLSKDNIF